VDALADRLLDVKVRLPKDDDLMGNLLLEFGGLGIREAAKKDDEEETCVYTPGGILYRC
jgi:hypothetical protein